MGLKIDAMGDTCPIPVIKTKKAIQQLEKGGEIEVWVDNVIATQNLSKMAKQLNFPSEVTKIDENTYTVKLTIGGVVKEEKVEKVTKKVAETQSGMVVLIGSETMGNGAEELGKLLMKGYIFALCNGETPPKTVIFLNGGAKITCDPHSPSLEDLKKMEESGVEILTCGTCVNFYQLELQVGELANMYEISQHLAEASKVINL